MMQTTKTNIVLCGFMSSGKTTIARPLAKELGYSFVDTDQLLVSAFGKTIPQMFAEGGEEYFRDREHEIARTAAAMEHTVISTGGGMMTFERNARVLAETGIVIYIHQDFSTCYRRLSGQKDRPLVKNNSREDLYRMYTARTSCYKKYASFTLENRGGVREAVGEIMQFLSGGTDR